MITALRRSGIAQGNDSHVVQFRRGSGRASETCAGLDIACSKGRSCGLNRRPPGYFFTTRRTTRQAHTGTVMHVTDHGLARKCIVLTQTLLLPFGQNG